MMKATVKNEKSGSRIAVRRGVTLVELAVVIGALLLLLSFVFPMAGAWKRGAFRTECIMNLRQVQVGVRSYANLNGLKQGDSPNLDPSAQLVDEIIGEEKYVESMPLCASGGDYSFYGNVIPPAGELFMTCSLAGSENHVPQDLHRW